MRAHLYKKRGNWQIVLVYEDAAGTLRQKWIDTQYAVRGNQRRAEQMLPEVIAQWQPILEPSEPMDNRKTMLVDDAKTSPASDDCAMLFSDYLIQWVETKRGKVQLSTFGGYHKDITRAIAPYFAQQGVLLTEVTEMHIEAFYQHKRAEGVTDNTLLHYQTLLNQALRKAAKARLIPQNPMNLLEKEERPKKEKYTPTVYNEEDISKLFHVLKGGDPLALVILMDITYGLRRSELVGLKWSAIDFQAKLIRINFKVTTALKDGKLISVMSDKMKNESSNRTLPLVPSIELELRELQKNQKRNMQLFGSGYCKDYRDFVFVNNLGKLMSPDYLSGHFKRLLQKNDLKYIRFHDLRHTCATMLRRKKITLQEIQLWLGHSTYMTTADIYTHLDFVDKLQTANAAAEIVGKITSIFAVEDRFSRSSAE